MAKLSNSSSTPYDDVFRTRLNDCPSLIIPVVNEIYNCSHSLNEKITLFNNEFFITAEDGKQLERITDSNFQIGSTHYHLECQSTEDGTMLIRIFEYDSQIALQNASLNENHLTVEYPHTALFYLRQKRTSQDYVKITIKVPNDSCTYTVPILKIQTYSIDEIFEKKLFFLIPFHIFVYEHDFKSFNDNTEKLKYLKNIYLDILHRLNECTKNKELTEYQKQTIIDMSKKVLNHLAVKYENVKERIGETMGGKILNYEAKDILNAGIAQGLERGIEEGLSRGLEEARMELIRKKLKKHKSIEQIADELEEDVSVICDLIAAMQE